MTKELIQTFTNRITQSNKSELVVVLYDIFFAYIEEAETVSGEEQTKAYRGASQVLEHLKAALDFKYELATQLYPIYDYCERVIAKAMYKDMREELSAIKRIMTSLKEAFVEVAKADDSEVMMHNAQKVTAGLTYGKNDVKEAGDYDPSRGFLA